MSDPLTSIYTSSHGTQKTEKKSLPTALHHKNTMVSFKFSWFILLAFLVAIVHSGGVQSKKNKYKELTNLSPSMCTEGPKVYCKSKEVAKYCNKLTECKSYWLREGVSALNFD